MVNLIVLLLLSFVNIAYSKDDKMNFSEQIRSIQSSVQSVTVVVVPPSAHFRVALDEERLLNNGCTFVSRDTVRINELVDIAASSRLAPRSGQEGFEKRGAILFELSDSSQVRLILGQQFVGVGSVKGELTIVGVLNKSPINADASIIENVYRWAVTVDEFENSDIGKSRMCDYLRNKYKK